MPVLWDKETGTIVSNESADIVRIFDEWGGANLYPPELRAEIDAVNGWVYDEFQNGVYRAGFAARRRPTTRRSAASSRRWTGWRRCSATARTSPATRSPRPTGACSPRCCASTPSTTRTSAATARRLIEYPHLIAYTKRLYQQPRIAETFSLEEIKRHYYTTHDELNPKRIIPAGPLDLGFTA